MSDKYSEGKINEDDEGDLEFKIGASDGRVIMDWGSPLSGSDSPLRRLVRWRKR